MSHYNYLASEKVGVKSPKFDTKIGNFRWRIVAVLFLATTINYIDRNVFSFLTIDIGFQKAMLGISEDITKLSAEQQRQFDAFVAKVDTAFKIAYGLGFLLMGWLIDKIGSRRGFSLAIVVWSIAGIASGLVNAVGLLVSRFVLGIGEAGNFPSAIKAVAEWFPKRERSFATGVFNAGANIGIIFTAIFVPIITLALGWQMAFITTGALGLILLFFWLWLYRKPEEHPKVLASELAYIKSDEIETEKVTDKKVSWAKCFTYKQTWAFALAKFLTDPIWWFYLVWLPKFFNQNEALETKLDLKNIGIPFLVIYLVSDLGSMFFGWVSSKLIQQGWSVNKARKYTMLLCALCVVPIFFASITSSIVVAVILISLATAAHQGWSANLFTTTSDMFPRQAVSSVVGIGGTFGALGGAILAFFADTIINSFGFVTLFTIAGINYLLALAIFQFLVPKLETIKQ